MAKTNKEKLISLDSEQMASIMHEIVMTNHFEAQQECEDYDAIDLREEVEGRIEEWLDSKIDEQFWKDRYLL